MAPDPAIQVQFTYTFDDRREAARLMLRKQFLAPAPLIIMAIVACVYFSGVLQPLLSPTAPAPGPTTSAILSPQQRNVALWQLCLNVLPYVFVVTLIWYFFFRSTGRRKRWQKDDDHLLHTVTLSASGIQWQTAISTASNKWESYRRVVEGSSIFLLYLRKHQAIILPKRTMTPAQIDAARALFANHITGNAALPAQRPTPIPSPPNDAQSGS